jgi:hypothetical protein
MSGLIPKSKTCHYCEKEFIRPDYLQKHIDRVHLKKPVYFVCSLCSERFHDILEFQNHKHTHYVSQNLFTLYKQTLEAYKIYRHIIPENIINVRQCFTQDVKNNLHELISYELNLSPVVKFSILFAAEYTKVGGQQELLEVQLFPLRSSLAVITKLFEADIPSIIEEIITEIETRSDDIVTVGSGWVLTDGIYIDLALTHVHPISGSGRKYIVKRSPYDISNPSFIHTIDNTDEFCFLDAVASGFMGAENNYDKDYFPYRNFAVNNFKFKTLSFPMKINDIIKFEKLNAHLYLKINILFLDADRDCGGVAVYSGYVSKFNYPQNLCKTVNLLLTFGDTPAENHYHNIKNVHKYLRKTYFEGKKSYSKEVICVNCFNKFSSAAILQEHEHYCYQNKCQMVTLGTDYVEFEHHNKLGKSNVIGFFDFECCNQNIMCKNCESILCVCNKKTKKLKSQVPICYSLLIVNSINKCIIFKKTYTGYDAAEDLVQTLIDLQDSLHIYIASVIPLKMTAENDIHFANAKTCYICCEVFQNQYNRVRDHDHGNGNYLGAAHNECNLKRRKAIVIPLYCHNFIGYDSHPILSCLGAVFNNSKNLKVRIDILPKNLEKITNIRIGMFTLNDSLSFLSAPLDTLIMGLKKDNHEFNYISQMDVLNISDVNYIKKLNLMTNKGIYPYDWVSSIEQLENQIIFPDKKYFFNTLLNSDITSAQYDFGKNVFSTFQHINNMLDYTKFYCELDVYLLCEAFNKFRDLAVDEFELDPSRFVSLPSFAFSSMLRMTKVRIAPLNNIDMFLMIKNGIRGGHSFITERRLKAVNYPTDNTPK